MTYAVSTNHKPHKQQQSQPNKWIKVFSEKQSNSAKAVGVKIVNIKNLSVARKSSIKV